MKLNLRVLSSAGAFVVSCVVSAAVYYYKRRTIEINEVMIFCKLQYNPYNYFDKLLGYIKAATQTVNVCMPGIHNPAIQGKLVELMIEKKITMRIVIDQDGYNESTQNFIKELVEVGVQIKFAQKMQHQFCLIDDKTLMTGTLNWGNDLCMDHWNYVYVTGNQRLVEPARREFYSMWQRLPNNIWFSSETHSESESDVVLDEVLEQKETTEVESCREIITPELHI